MIIELTQVVQAIEESSDAYTLFLDTLTGKTVYLPDPHVTGESDEALEIQLETEPHRFLPFPTKYDVHEYRIMEAFIGSLPAGKAKQDFAVSILGKGAFRRFKGVLRFYNLEQHWYEFRAEAFRDYSAHWCRENGIEYKI